MKSVSFDTCVNFIIFIVLFLFSMAIFQAGKDARAESFDARVVVQSASELDYPPFCLVKPDGSADGFSVDLLKAVIHVSGREVSFKVGPWHKIKQELTEGKIDVLPMVSRSSEREKIFDFSIPYMIMHGDIFVRKEDRKKISGLAALNGRKVMVMEGDTAHEWVLKQKIKPVIITTDTYAEAFKLLAQGKYDAILAQKLMGLQLLEMLDLDNIVTVGDPETHLIEVLPTRMTMPGFEQKFCFAVREGDKDLLAALNEGLAVITANGTFDRLCRKWFKPVLPSADASSEEVLKQALIIVFPLLLAGIVAWIFFLKRQVNISTKHLSEEIRRRQWTEEQQKETINQLGSALAEVKTLRGILPVCSFCKKIRNDEGYWQQVETYISEHSDAKFSHGLCPDCLNKYYKKYLSKRE